MVLLLTVYIELFIDYGKVGEFTGGRRGIGVSNIYYKSSFIYLGDFGGSAVQKWEGDRKQYDYC